MILQSRFFFFSSRRRHTRWPCDWSSDVCSSDLDERGNIASGVAEGAQAVFALAGGENGEVAAQPAVPAAPKIGEPAPPLKLPDLKGKTVNLAGLKGKNTLVLFWNPGCGFCQQMLDDLKDFEANPPEGAPRLLVVSTGSAEENRAMGLRST